MKYNDDQGFILLETVVAVAIVAFAFAVILPIFSDSYSRSQKIIVEQKAAAEIDLLLSSVVLKRDLWNLPIENENDEWSWVITSVPLEQGQENNPDGFAVNLIVELQGLGRNKWLVRRAEQIVWIRP